MVSIRERVQLLAGNLVARMEGGELKPLQPVTGPHYAMPDIGGRTVFLKDNQVIAKGRIPLLRRFIYDQSYFRLRT